MTVIKKTLYKLSLRTVALIITIVLLSSCSVYGKKNLTVEPFNSISPSDTVNKPVGLTDEVRGVWIASIYNINFPSAPDLSNDKLRKEIESIVNNVLKYKLNTIFFQVHPASDAMYRSDIFPVSDYLFSGDVLRFDPLEYMIKLCHEKGIALYAWVNPLRVSATSHKTKEEAVNALPKGSPAQDDSMTVFYGDGKLYYNCGVESVRQLVVDTVDEIAANYDVDGIVFDDYFYPYPVNDASGVPYKFDDGQSYTESETKLSLGDWRRDNVNQMIKECYVRLKARDPEIQFGVAPFGIWQNDNGKNGGTATNGMEAYSELYCDAVAWIKGKYVDFISPQLYWKCDSNTAPFEELISFWSTVADGTGVDVLVSHGVYQYEDWESPGELLDQIDIARNYISYRGSILYGYESLVKNQAGLATDTSKAFTDKVYYYHSAQYKDGIVMSVDNDIEISGNAVTFHGYSDSAYPLTVNGTPIERSHGGYFKCKLALNDGENAFEFICGEYKKSIRVIK